MSPGSTQGAATKTTGGVEVAVPSLRGTGCTVASPSVLPANMAASSKQFSPASGAKPLT